MKIGKKNELYSKEYFCNKIISFNTKEEFYKLQDYLYSLGFTWPSVLKKQEYIPERYLIIYNQGKGYNILFIRQIDCIQRLVINYKDLNL